MKNLYLKGLIALTFSMILFFAVNTNAQEHKVCVIADIHYFDPELLINDGTAFQTYLAMDRKLLQESEAILESVIDSLIAEAPNTVIVAGDLTKDGEKTGHEKVAAYFQELEDAGIEVVVTPGNHDINNPHAVSFDGEEMIPVPSVTPAEFSEIYADFGFSQAVESDENSLSFVYNLNDDLTIISMDVCRYDSNYVDMHPTTSGGFKPEVLEWVISKAESAVAEGRTVLGVMHHGILEHYAGQKQLFSEYVIDEWEDVSSQLADAGIHVVFTGHYHAQDMALKTTDSSFLFDIETGSTVTYPCPYRVINISDENVMNVTGKRVQEVEYETGDLTFQEYALNFIETGLPVLVKGMLMAEPYNLDEATATMVEPAITESFIAHYEGDEGEPSAETQAIIDVLVANPDYQVIGYTIQSIWNDPQPGDWDLEVNLSSGAITSAEEALINGEMKIYPNPSTGRFVLTGDFGQHSIAKIYSISGKEVFSINLTDGDNVINADLAEGLYVVEITSGNVKLRNKIIVQ